MDLQVMEGLANLPAIGGGGVIVNVCILEVGTYCNIMNVLRFVVEVSSGILTTISFPRIVLQF